jgi:hypothetical protein
MMWKFGECDSKKRVKVVAHLCKTDCKAIYIYYMPHFINQFWTFK